MPDNAIQNVILEAPWFKTCKRLCAYISCSALREVDTYNILSEVLQNPATGLSDASLSVLLTFELPCDGKITGVLFSFSIHSSSVLETFSTLLVKLYLWL